MSIYNPNTLLSNPKLDAKVTVQEEHDIVEDDDLLASTASASEMTGLAPTVTHDEYEAQSYEEIYPYLASIPQPPGVQTPDVTIGDDIHAEYSTEVTTQPKRQKRPPH